MNISPKLSPELLFLIACCKTEPSNDDINFILSYPSTINQQLLTDMALRHGVLPLVYKTLKNLRQPEVDSGFQNTPNISTNHISPLQSP